MKLRLVLAIPLLTLPLCACTPVDAAHSTSDPAAIDADLEQTTPIERPEGALDWSEARERIGSTATVCGPVVSTFTATESEGQPTFLNLGRDYPDTAGFTAVVFGDYRSAFPFDPTLEYDHSEICVSGEIRAHQQFVQIEARSPEQIIVID